MWKIRLLLKRGIYIVRVGNIVYGVFFFSFENSELGRVSNIIGISEII